MKKPLVLGTWICAVLCSVAISAQSTLGSLFDRYDVKASFAGLAGSH